MVSLSFPLPAPCQITLSPLSQRKDFLSLNKNSSFHLQRRPDPSVSLPKLIRPCVWRVDRESQFDIGSSLPEVEELPEGLRRDLMPKHVAIFPDGIRREGKRRGLTSEFANYLASAYKFKEMVSLCYKWGIQVVSVFAFSYEDWRQPENQVVSGLNYFIRAINSYLEQSVRKGVRISVIGDRSKLPEFLQNIVIEVEEATKSNSQFHLIVSLDYDGHDDITQACKKVVGKVQDGLIQLEDINNNVIEQELQTNCAKFPNPDLFIRTSGGNKTSNFMCWQLAYSELYFVDKKWLEFDKADFVDALGSFQNRQRRYGGHSEET